LNLGAFQQKSQITVDNCLCLSVGVV